MTANRGNDVLNGVWCPALMPVDDKLEPDVPKYIDHCRWVLEEGCHGLVMFGTTGEANSFSVEERIQALDAAIDAGLPPERMMVGTGCAALSDTVRLTRHAIDRSALGILMLPPFYYKGASDEALAASFDRVIEGVGTEDFRLVLYHIPGVSGVAITPALVDLVAERHPETLAGIKDSTGDWDHSKMLIERFSDLAVFPGAENLVAAGLEVGGAGCISAGCNVNASAIRALYDAALAGEDVTERHAEVERLRLILQRYALIPAMKQMIADAKGDPGWTRLRPPLMPLSEVNAKALMADLQSLDFRLAA
ncbi:MAG: dihydrodipicolinate synthase family protein [Alphaproteobacteria bacterium]|nr:dihydrodipicolinate synthase family protein [Alphaproteobacteria bacterium]